MMPSRLVLLRDRRRVALRAPAICAILLAALPGARSQSGNPDKSPATQLQKSGAVSPRVSLSPRFVPGQTFHYELEFETTTATSRSGSVLDPQGPSSLLVDWDATVRIEILPAGASAPGGIRLRTTYEKSTASVRSDTFDPAAAETQDQYKKLEGKSVEFTLDATGKVKSISGLSGIVEGEKASQSAGQWIAQISASAGAPAGGVAPGQTWSSEQPASSLPIAGMVWRSDYQYLRNEDCYPPNPNLPPGAGAPDSAAHSQLADSCAVILANLSLRRPKALRDPTPPEFRKNGVQTAGTWEGSGQSLMYVSLATGFVVSVTQTGMEEMNVTLKSGQGASMHYSGTISSRSQVALVQGDPSQNRSK